VRRRRGLIVVFAMAMAAMRPIIGIAAQEQNKERRQLFVTGAKLWPVYCAQCHNAWPDLLAST